MIKYRYAYDENEEIVTVNSLNRDNDLGKFFCVGCGKELIPRLGEIRKKHFAHKVDFNCSPETYLHKLAKNTFFNIYKNCLEKSEPFILEYNVHNFCNFFENQFKEDCDLGIHTREFNLTDYFTKIVLEQREGNLIPDIKIYNPKTNESIYIEITVTHQSEPQKRSSVIRIIEFEVDQEEDVEFFEKKIIPINIERGLCRTPMVRGFGS
jgi:hypothetical protein